MTQDEYNNLSPEEQNALFATEVLGWINSGGDWLLEDGATFPGFVDQSDTSVTDFFIFNPHKNLDHAFMGVDKLEKETFTLEWMVGKNWWACLILDSDVDAKWHSALGDTPNQAIMLMCLRAKGVVE